MKNTKPDKPADLDNYKDNTKKKKTKKKKLKKRDQKRPE